MVLYHPDREGGCAAMISFSQADPAQQSLLMSALLIVLIVSLFSLIAAFGSEKRKLHGLIDTGLFLLLFVTLTKLANLFSRIHAGEPTEDSFPLPMGLLWCATGAAIGYLIYEAIMRYRKRDAHLSRNCVKQAMDLFPCAVCYFAPSGEVKLCNLQMHRLFHRLAQKELQNLDDLTQTLGGCDDKSGVILLSDVRQTYLFPDGTVWRYAQSEIVAKGVTYTEALFSDVTELYEKNLELHRQTAQLQTIAQEPKRLSDNVQTLAEERETLVVKSKLHDLMGSGLLAIRQILRQKTTSAENAAAVMQFRRAVGILQAENVRPQYDAAAFIRDAALSGIRVEITGALPKEKRLLRLLLPMLREACVNAARHADATTLYVAALQTERAVTLRITNDGNPPAGEVVPRGGLAVFGRRIAAAGGRMEIRSQPAFMLTVTLPTETQENREEEE